MNEESLVSKLSLFMGISTLAIIIPLMLSAVQLKDLTKVIGNKEQTNISEYLTSQDQKIESLRNTITERDLRIDQLEKRDAENNETFNMAMEYLTKSETTEMWAKWSVEICPKYEQAWYCEGDN